MQDNMRLLLVCLSILLSSTTFQEVSSFSFDKRHNNIASITDLKKASSGLSQKDVIKASSSTMSCSTRREPIRMPSTTPMVPWTPEGSDRATMMDINSAMYRDGTIMISRFIDEEAANEIIAILLWMRSNRKLDNISMYFNVPGGLMRPALAIYDIMKQTKEQGCEIETCNLGLCTGMGAFLCAAGTKGRRSAMPNSRFLLQRMGLDKPVRGQATDIVLEVRNIKMWNERVEQELSELTGHPLEKMQHDMRRDFYLSSDEAVQYGLIDQVLLPAPMKRARRGQNADLGAFEGEEDQKYQGQDFEAGGWGSQQQQQPPQNNNDDDDGPKIAKG